jgi:hypothetical protein
LNRIEDKFKPIAVSPDNIYLKLKYEPTNLPGLQDYNLGQQRIGKKVAINRLDKMEVVKDQIEQI